MIIKKVIWSEGIFLSQQHFQQWELSQEQTQRLFYFNVAPLHWGVRTLVVDEEALLNGELRVKKCELIFQNGMLVCYDEREHPALCCDLKAHQHERIEIFLCMPANRLVSGISGYRQLTKPSAWEVEYQPIADEYDSNREHELMLARMNLKLLRDDEARDQYWSLKIAEINNRGHQFQLSKNFIPAITCIKASWHLQDLLRQIMEMLRAKIYLLTERRFRHLGDIAEFGHSDLVNFLLLKVFNENFFQLQHLSWHPEFHPERLYQLLTGLCASLCTFSKEKEIVDIPAYQHENLTDTFMHLSELIKYLLDSVLPQRMATLKLQRQSESLYLLDNIDSLLFDRVAFFVAVNFESSETAWISQFAKQAKIAACTAIEVVIASALPGVKLTHTQRPPNKLPVKIGYEYFYLEPHGHVWEQIKSERNLAIFLPYVFSKAEIEVVTVQVRE